MKTRKPHLKQVDPPASFQIVDPAQNQWTVSIRDNTDSFESPICFTSPLSKWEIGDIIKAGGRECQSGEGVVTIQKIIKGLVTEWGIFKVRYFFGRWGWQKVRGT